MEQQTHSGGHGVLGDAQVEAIRLEASADFPGPLFPVLVYRGAFGLQPSAAERAAHLIEQTFAQHHWTDSWRDGVYDFHHYHSTAHEVLGCYSGRATLQLGGPDGPTVTVARGDVVVLPAGAAHKRVEATRDFRVVGAYERGRDYDMLLGDPSVRMGAEARILAVPGPKLDPVYGEVGPLLRAWSKRTSLVPPAAH
jgi:uncharacterized protein YjlB